MFVSQLSKSIIDLTNIPLGNQGEMDSPPHHANPNWINKKVRSVKIITIIFMIMTRAFFRLKKASITIEKNRGNTYETPKSKKY